MGENRRILLVDDHESNRVFLERILRRAGVEFFHAQDGLEALVIARRERPDLAIMDVCMPGMDGLEVCESIRKDPDLTAMRIVLVSAILGRSELCVSADENGADGYFAKPFEIEEVRRCVGILLRETAPPS